MEHIRTLRRRRRKRPIARSTTLAKKDIVSIILKVEDDLLQEKEQKRKRAFEQWKYNKGYRQGRHIHNIGPYLKMFFGKNDRPDDFGLIVVPKIMIKLVLWAVFVFILGICVLNIVKIWGESRSLFFGANATTMTRIFDTSWFVMIIFISNIFRYAAISVDRIRDASLAIAALSATMSTIAIIVAIIK